MVVLPQITFSYSTNIYEIKTEWQVIIYNTGFIRLQHHLKDELLQLFSHDKMIMMKLYLNNGDKVLLCSGRDGFLFISIEISVEMFCMIMFYVIAVWKSQIAYIKIRLITIVRIVWITNRGNVSMQMMGSFEY